MMVMPCSNPISFLVKLTSLRAANGAWPGKSAPLGAALGISMAKYAENFHVCAVVWPRTCIKFIGMCTAWHCVGGRLHWLGDKICVLKAQESYSSLDLLDVASLDFPKRFGNKLRGTHGALLGFSCDELPLPNVIDAGTSGSRDFRDTFVIAASMYTI